MKTQKNSNGTARSLLRAGVCLIALGSLTMAGGLLNAGPASAQTAGTAPAKNVSLNFQNAPIQTVLHTLFTSEGINNSIDQDVQGSVSISVNDVPFDVALRTLLRSANPPLTFDRDNGIYHIKVQRYEAAAAVTPTTTPGTTAGGSDTTSGDTTAQGRYYRIAINHYDAFYMAEMLYQAGVKKAAPVRVPSDPLSGSSGQNGQSGGYGGQSGGFGGGGFGGGQGGFGGTSGGFGGTSSFGRGY